MNDINFHLAIFLTFFEIRILWNSLQRLRGETWLFSMYLQICAFPSDHQKHLNYFLGNKLFFKITFMEAETHQPNMVKFEHLFGSEMKQWVIFCRIILCQGVSYLVQGSNFKIDQYFFKQWMFCYNSVKSSRTENHSIKVNVNSDSGYRRNRLTVSISHKM